MTNIDDASARLHALFPTLADEDGNGPTLTAQQAAQIIRTTDALIELATDPR